MDLSVLVRRSLDLLGDLLDLPRDLLDLPRDLLDLPRDLLDLPRDLLVLPRARLCFVAELLVKVVVGVALAKAAYLQSAALLAKGALRRQTALTLRLQCAAGVFTSRCRVVVEVSLPMVHTIFFGTA